MTITRHDVEATIALPAGTEVYQRTSDVPASAALLATAPTTTPGTGATVTTSAVTSPTTGQVERLMTVTRTTSTDTISGTTRWTAAGLVAGRLYEVEVTARVTAGVDVLVLPVLLPTGSSWSPPAQVAPVRSVVVRRAFFVADPSARIGLQVIAPLGVASASVRVMSVVAYDAARAAVLDLRPERAEVTLDESWTPYIRATLTCPAPSPEVMPMIDPRAATRVRVAVASASAASRTAADLPALLGGTVTADWSTIFAGPPVWTAARLSALVGDPYDVPPRPDLDASRSFDLQLRSRSVDWATGVMTLELTSDEMALQDFARWEEITPAFTPPTTTSLVALVTWGLRLLGWSLAPGALDATIDSTSTIWNLGETLWDFLDSHVRAANRRLWCDELRRWRLTEPFAGTTGTALVIDSPTSLVDTVARGDGYADAAVVIFEWPDALGAQQRAYGYADWTSGQPVTLVQRRRNTVGTTAQAYELASGLRRRAATRGRAVVVEAVANPRATPGMPLVVTSPTAQVRDAMVSAVTWTYPDDVMTVRTRDAATT